jgi:hypothetical protein
MVLLHWETLYCLRQHGQGDGPPWKTGRVVQHGRSHGEPQASGTGWGCREALSYGTAYDGLEADRAIFESAVRTLAEGNTLRATARMVQVGRTRRSGCRWLLPLWCFHTSGGTNRYRPQSPHAIPIRCARGAL